MNANEVQAAFEILLEELEGVVASLNEGGAEALKRGDYEAARQAIEKAAGLTEFRERVRALQKEWATFSLRIGPQGGRIAPKGRHARRRGLRTPEDAFRLPILESLAELGGRASMSDVLPLVEKKMKGTLNRFDYEPLPSHPKSIRWRNTAQWCRWSLVREGLMKGDSPTGIWEITDEGLRSLRATSKSSE